ncbi:MAG: 16S rRNA (guanine(966)-N(2))-methyltransferase RsmD [Clostridia bacterium]|nr:16S rRNA (guanine(966)-N(2))-methyltransferase RsmD [Clostridia bacterium]
MQVISGKYRARKLVSPDSARPTLQRIKISTFSLIQEFVKEDIEVLDLFAGSGALGIECLSRGAKFVDFIELDKKACECIKKNLRETDSSFYSILNTDYKDALNRLVKDEKAYDIIFVDPPYEKGFYVPAIEIIERYNLVKSGGIIVVESLKNKPINFQFANFEVYKSRDYGITNITILKRIDV